MANLAGNPHHISLLGKDLVKIGGRWRFEGRQWEKDGAKRPLKEGKGGASKVGK